MKKTLLKYEIQKKIIVKFDKTGNLYYYIVADFLKAICQKFNKIYKKVRVEWENNINNESRITTTKH